MRQLKQILIDRITNILELQHIFQYTKPNLDPTKHEYILSHKKAERIRHMRESDILAYMNNLAPIGPNIEKELYECTREVFEAFERGEKEEETLRKGEKGLAQLYCQFFDRNGFKEKSTYIRHLISRDEGGRLSPALFLGWLSEWSKKIYCQTLQRQIEKSFITRDRSPKQESTSFTVGLLDSKPKKSDKKFPQINSTFISNSEPPQLFLSTRTNIHSYFLDELQQYYKLTGIEGIDLTYTKTIKKRYQREEFLKSENLSKAVDVIIECSGNRAISDLMREYEQDYYGKFPRQISKETGNGKTNEVVKKAQPLPQMRRKPRNVTETDEVPVSNQSKLLSPKLSEIEFVHPDDLESRIKRIKIMSSFKSTKNNIQFPGITFKKEIKCVAPDKNLFKITKSKQDLVASLEKRLQDRDFFKCESLLSKYKSRDDPSFFNQSLITPQNSSPSRSKRASIPFISSVYDQKIKIGKNFELVDLKLGKKFQIGIKLYGQPAV